MPSSDFRISEPDAGQQLADRTSRSRSRSSSDLQDEASSLKRLRKPSDAPGDVVSAMSLHADVDRNDQYSRNISDARAWLGNADNALTERR